MADLILSQQAKKVELDNKKESKEVNKELRKSSFAQNNKSSNSPLLSKNALDEQEVFDPVVNVLGALSA